MHAVTPWPIEDFLNALLVFSNKRKLSWSSFTSLYMDGAANMTQSLENDIGSQPAGGWERASE